MSVLSLEKSYSPLTFVGHSKGGAEASANAVATGKNAIVFNPAYANLSAYDLGNSNYTESLKSYVVKGDILDTVNSATRFIVSGKKIGTRHDLKQQHFVSGWVKLTIAKTTAQVTAGVKNHLMGAVISALEKEGYK